MGGEKILTGILKFFFDVGCQHSDLLKCHLIGGVFSPNTNIHMHVYVYVHTYIHPCVGISIVRENLPSSDVTNVIYRLFIKEL